MPYWTSLPASGQPGHTGGFGPALLAPTAPRVPQGLLGLDRNRGPRVPSPAPRPRPRQPPRGTRPGRRCPPHDRQALAARSLASSSHLTARQARAGTSVDACTLSLRSSSSAADNLGRPWGGGAEPGQQRRPTALRRRQPAAPRVRASAPQGTPLWPRPKTEWAPPLADRGRSRGKPGPAEGRSLGGGAELGLGQGPGSRVRPGPRGGA